MTERILLANAADGSGPRLLISEGLAGYTLVHAAGALQAGAVFPQRPQIVVSQKSGQSIMSASSANTVPVGILHNIDFGLYGEALLVVGVSQQLPMPEYVLQEGDLVEFGLIVDPGAFWIDLVVTLIEPLVF